MIAVLGKQPRNKGRNCEAISETVAAGDGLRPDVNNRDDEKRWFLHLVARIHYLNVGCERQEGVKNDSKDFDPSKWKGMESGGSSTMMKQTGATLKVSVQAH